MYIWEFPSVKVPQNGGLQWTILSTWFLDLGFLSQGESGLFGGTPF